MKNVDLTTTGQKLIAAGGIVLLAVILYFILPPLAFIGIMLWVNLVIYGLLAVLLYNWELIWNMFKQWSWEATKKHISSNPLWYMYKFHDYVLEENQKINEHITSVTMARNQAFQQVTKLKKEIDKALAEEDIAVKKGQPESILRPIRNRVAIYDGQLKELVPKVALIDEQITKLTELYEIRNADVIILKDTLDAKAQEYETLKTIATAVSGTEKILSKNSTERRDFDESLKVIESRLSQYAADIVSFDRNVLPTIARMSTEQSALEQEGIKLIEEYKQKRLAL